MARTLDTLSLSRSRSLVLLFLFSLCIFDGCNSSLGFFFYFLLFSPANFSSMAFRYSKGILSRLRVRVRARERDRGANNRRQRRQEFMSKFPACLPLFLSLSLFPSSLSFSVATLSLSNLCGCTVHIVHISSLLHLLLQLFTQFFGSSLSFSGSLSLSSFLSHSSLTGNSSLSPRLGHTSPASLPSFPPFGSRSLPLLES